MAKKLYAVKLVGPNDEYDGINALFMPGPDEATYCMRS